MEWLNYHHLRYFWTVATEGSLARAAEKLHVSQPSISEQIRELSKETDIHKLTNKVDDAPADASAGSSDSPR